MPPLYRNDRAYVAKREALRRQCRKNGTPCHICGRPFDFDLEWKHPLAFTADHVIPVANGGSMTGDLLPAHRACNSRRGAGKPVKKNEKPKNTREW